MGKKHSVIILLALLFVSNFTIFFAMSNVTGTSNSNDISFSYVDSNGGNYYYDITTETTEYQDNDILLPDVRRGAQNVAVICVKPSDYPNTRWSIAEHEDIMETINKFWQNTSYDEISINYLVKGWYDLGHNWSHYGAVNGAYLEVNDWQQVVKDAIALADPVIDFNTYDYVVVWINVAWWRGWASIGKNININTGEGAKTIAATLCGENSASGYNQVWGRTAHEMGHLFGLRHTHGSNKDGTKDYMSWYSLMARAYPSALNFYSSMFDTEAGWFPDGTNMETINVGGSGAFHVRPRYIDITGDTQALKVKISNAKYYMVEVIAQYDEDAWLPDDGVYIYLVDKDEPNDDECTDQDGVAGGTVEDCLWDVGQTFTDVANGITISIDDYSFDGYDITVTNAGDGESDLHIDDWGNPPGHPGPYETPDIWVDNPVNGWGHYRHTDSGGHPEGTGDEPLLNEINRLYARIWNIGEVDATGVVVKFYENEPIGAGDTGAWTLIGTKTINVPAGEDRSTYVLWEPEYSVSASSNQIMDIHSCVKVVIEKHVAEVDVWDNSAQENINFFEVIPTSNPVPLALNALSRFGPVTGTFAVANPFKAYKNIYVCILDVTEGWEVTGAGVGQVYNFAPFERMSFDITVTPGADIDFTDSVEASLVACYEDEPPQDEEFIGDIHLIPYSGVTISASVLYRSDLEIGATIIDENHFKIYGKLDFLDGVPDNLMPSDERDRQVYLNIVNKDNGEKYNATLLVDNYGDYETSVTLKTGVYKINGYYAGTKYITCSATVTLMVDLINTSVWTSKIFPGFGTLLTFGTLFLVAVSLKMIFNKRKS
ncbi:MAG: hypothetical protein ACFFDW_15615 [Candidatus Thorarchaeota archaeon]